MLSMKKKTTAPKLEETVRSVLGRCPTQEMLRKINFLLKPLKKFSMALISFFYI